MARKNGRNMAVPQMSFPGMEPPPATASPEPLGNVAATCSGACRRSTQHAVEQLRHPDGSLIVRRICTVCEAVEQITTSKVVAERVLDANQTKNPTMKDTETTAHRLPIDSQSRTADNGHSKS